jgi:hypothetical protein
MIAENQIREKLGRYLSGELSLDHFEDWLVERSWNMHKDSDESAQKLASAVELRLAEHSSGHLDDAALRDELRQLLNPKVVQISFGQALPPAPQQPPNNVVIEMPKYQVIRFTVRADVSPAVPAAAGFADTAQSVAHA